MNQILYSKNAQKTKVIFLIIIIILLICALGFIVLGLVNSNSGKITKGVVIHSIDVGGMTVTEAEELLKQQQETLDAKTFILKYRNREVSVSGDEIDLKYFGDFLQEAANYGKNGNIIENSIVAIKSLWKSPYVLDSEIVLNEVKLKEKVDVLLEEENATAIDDTYEISGDKILITKGHDGVVARMETLVAEVVESATDTQDASRITVKVDVQSANRIDFEELYQEVYVERQNATYAQKDDGSVEYVKEVIGISFNKEIAENEYFNIGNDEILQIDLIKEMPEITTANLEDVLFADVLATFKTNYNASNVDRSTNLAVAARNMNDTILLPGEIFSYNEAVGQRTYANGFKDAHIFSGGKVVDGLGGGICQISSTLYNAVLMSNLEIVERKNHMMYPEYVEPSFDATVVWGSIDFRFKNNRETPIKITASVKNGVATVTIYGKKTDDEPIVELKSVIEQTIPYTTVTEYDETLPEGTTIVTQSPVNGYVSKGYKILKDKSGNVISETLISSDSYRQTSKIVTVGTKKVETPIENTTTTPTEPEGSNNGETNNGTSGTQEGSNSSNNGGLPTGWDSPENPYYTGN